MKNIRNYSVKFYHIFVVFLFVSLSFQWGFAQAIGGQIDGKIKLYFETVEKTKAQMDDLLAGDSLVYLQVYAEFSSDFTAEQIRPIYFDASTFSWALCDESGTFASNAVGADAIILGNITKSCPQGSQDYRDGGAAAYTFATRDNCPKYGFYANVAGGGGAFNLHLATPSTHLVKMGAIGFKILSSDGFFVRMASTGKQIDESFVSVIFNIRNNIGSIGWSENNGIVDWGKAGPDRFDISQVGGVVVKKGFKNKSV